MNFPLPVVTGGDTPPRQRRGEIAFLQLSFFVLILLQFAGGAHRFFIKTIRLRFLPIPERHATVRLHACAGGKRERAIFAS